MKWFPKLNITEEHDKWLTDLELRKVKQLKETLRKMPISPKGAETEKEIYNIYLAAIQRNKKEEQISIGLKDWLNSEELVLFEDLKEKIKTAASDKGVFCSEAKIYEIYLKSICRQTDFPLKEHVGKYIEMMKDCQTDREAEIFSTVIVDLLRTAR